MKNLLLVVLLFIGFSSVGQIRVAKINLGSSATGAPGLAFEHVRKKRLAWQVGGSYYIPNSRESFFYNSLLDGRSLERGKITGFSFSLEHRWYTKRARRDHIKPYVGLFGRYYQFQIDSDFTDQQTKFEFDLKSTNVGAGVQVGVQYVIRDKIAFDIGLIGVGFGRSSIQGQVVTTGGDPSIGKLEDDVTELPLLGNRIRMTSDGDVHSFSTKYGSLIYRGGIYFGILF